MKFDVQTILNFEKLSKKLKRKFPSLKVEINNLIDELESNPFEGKPIGKGFYKVRLAIKSKGKGKRGGVRTVRRCDCYLC